MAKPELRDHRKFLKLKRLLGAPTPHVIGYLDCLWHRGYQTGDPRIGDADDVEAAAEFTGERGTFATAAFQAGLIDQDEEGNFSIHDLYEHAPAYVKKRMGRKGTAPKGTRPESGHGEDDFRAGEEPPNSLPNGNQVCPRGHENDENRPARHTKTDLDPRSENQEPTTRPTDPPKPPAEAAGEKPSVGSSEKNETFDPLKADQEAKRLFVERWNAAGMKPLKILTSPLQGRLFAALLDPWWAENYPAAIDRASRSPFLRDGTERHKGRLDPMEFLSEPDLVRRILDGDFDPRQKPVRAPPRNSPEDRAQVAEDARRKRDEAEARRRELQAGNAT